VAYIFYFFTLSKGTDNAQSFLCYVLSPKLFFAFYSLQHHVHTPSPGMNRRQL